MLEMLEILSCQTRILQNVMHGSCAPDGLVFWHHATLNIPEQNISTSQLQQIHCPLDQIACASACLFTVHSHD